MLEYLNNRWISKIAAALLDAFNYESLEYMIRVRLDKNLEEIVLPNGIGLSEVAYKLVLCYGSEEGGIKALLNGACAERPCNKCLCSLAEEVASIEFKPLSQAEAALTSYYYAVTKQMNMAPFGAFYVDVGEGGGGKPPILELASTYVDLNTTLRKPTEDGKPKALSLLEAVGLHRHIVLLGSPGAGKSTFLRYLALVLAQHNLEPSNFEPDEQWKWASDEPSLTPIYVQLRDISHLAQPQNPAEPRHLWNVIVNWLRQYNAKDAAKTLKAKLERGEVILLLDGLDEVPQEVMRAWMRSALNAFLAHYSKCRAIITCRKLAFEDPSWHFDGIEQFTIASLTDKQIADFIEKWYGEVQRAGLKSMAETGRLTESLLVEVQRRDIHELAQTPLLLSVIIAVHANDGMLPDSRVRLFKRAIEVMLNPSEQLPDVRRMRDMLASQGRNIGDLERVLYRVAYTVHEQGAASDENELADISAHVLIADLATLHRYRDRAWATELLQLLSLRTGLLFERDPGVYTFTHRAFQEYLAGAWLAAKASQDIAQEIRRYAANETKWREVILLAAGRLALEQHDLATPMMMIAELCPKKVLTTEQAWRQVWLAGQIWEEIGSIRAADIEIGEELLDRVCKRLAKLIAANTLTPVERAAAGRTLGHIGDRRPGVGVCVDDSQSPPRVLPDITWCQVPAGSFQMGGDRLVARWYWPGKAIDINYDYQISKYPVTYAQFEPFVRAGGYEERRYWTDAGWNWRITPNLDMEKGITTHPKYWDDSRWHIPNHPVVGLSWYECVAYTRWLSEQLDVVVRLPTEAEWEKAARYRDGRYQVTGSETKETKEWEKAARYRDGRYFPWGNSPRTGYANVDETYERHRFASGRIDTHVKIGEHFLARTTPVGMYATHASDLGLCDLTGNVWEWLLSAQTTYLNATYEHKLPESIGVEGECRREMRGGSWLNDIARGRLAYRASNPPSSQDSTDGFRLVMDTRYNLAEWNALQRDLAPSAEPIAPPHSAGRISEIGREQIKVECLNGNVITVEPKQVAGASVKLPLCVGESVTLVHCAVDTARVETVRRHFIGTVRNWNRMAAFGYIGILHDKGQEVEVYFHQNDFSCKKYWEKVKVGDTVSFELEDALLYGEIVPEARNVACIPEPRCIATDAELLQAMPGDSRHSDRGKFTRYLDLAASDLSMHDVTVQEITPDHPDFYTVYDMLFEEFGAKGEIEPRQVLRKRSEWDPTAPLPGQPQFEYHLVVLKHPVRSKHDGLGTATSQRRGFYSVDGQEIIGARDHNVIYKDGMIVVHLSHSFLASQARSKGLDTVLRAVPVVHARCFAAAIGHPEAPIILYAEQEPVPTLGEIQEAAWMDWKEGCSEAIESINMRFKRLAAYQGGWFKKIGRLGVCAQPDFSTPEQIDSKGGPQMIPLNGIWRFVGAEDARTTTGSVIRRAVSAVYDMYEASGLDPRAIAQARASLAMYPAEDELVPLIPPLESIWRTRSTTL